jgi:3-oxoacyl-[acyl-carrier-protein] synthase-3
VSAGLVDIGVYLPPAKVGLDYFGHTADPGNPMFDPPLWRRHVTDETAVDLIGYATGPIADRLGPAAIRDVDVLITHVQLPDQAIVGSGTEVLGRLGCRPEWVIDLHNGGCAAFPYMLKLADTLLTTTSARSALLCVVANFAGQVYRQPTARASEQAPIPGDGAAVALVAADRGAPILGVEARHFAESAGAMRLEADDSRKYWQAGTGELRVAFTDGMLTTIAARGRRLVPDVVEGLCRRLGTTASEVDALITNQPNRKFLAHWHTALGLPAARHHDTFDDYGNLFAAGIPVTLEHAARGGSVRDGDLVVLAGFAHAGDVATAAALRWKELP